MTQPNVVFNAEGIDLVGLTAGADLSAKQFYIVKQSASTVVLCDTGGEKALGVLQNAPASGEAALVRVFGQSKVVAGNTFSSAGSLVQATTSGTADVATTGDFPVGQMLVTAASGDKAMMLVNTGYVALA